jgi:hypothetical protein
MQEPQIFRIVDITGRVHHANLTSAACDAFMSLMLADGKLSGLRSERMESDSTRNQSATLHLGTPATVEQMNATANPLPEIEPGRERDALREAIESLLDASARLDAANQAVDRASAFVAARQSEFDAMTAAHQSEIEASGANLAEALKAGGAALEASRLIDRSAVLDAEVRRDTAKAALEHLTAEQMESDSTHKSAETAVRLATMAVKRADVAAMVRRLIDVKGEFTALATAIDAARFSDVPVTLEAESAMRIELLSVDGAAKVWHSYSAALRDDPAAIREDFA